jgi:hypothetical protein
VAPPFSVKHLLARAEQLGLAGLNAPARSETGAAAAPAHRPWAVPLASVMQETSPEAIPILLGEVRFSWHETLGVPAKCGRSHRAARHDHARPDLPSGQRVML